VGHGPLNGHDPVNKTLITQSHVYDCHYGIDLDAHSTDVMVKANRLENNHQASIFLEEGSTGNYVLDNTINANGSVCAICMYSNLAQKKPRPLTDQRPVADNWVVGNVIQGRGMYTMGISMSSASPQDAARRNVFFENTVSSGLDSWDSRNLHLFDNHVMTSTGDEGGFKGAKADKITFFKSPDPLPADRAAAKDPAIVYV
jgi:hypothetical protein